MKYENFKWKKTYTAVCTHIYIDKQNRLIYKKYKSSNIVTRIRDNYEKIKHFHFVPKMSFDFEENIVIEEFFTRQLNWYTKPINYDTQLLNIDRRLKQSKYYHNDYKLEWFCFVRQRKIGHFYLDDDNQIRIIDWERLSENEASGPYLNNIDPIIFYCKYNCPMIITFSVIVLLSLICVYISINKIK
jgi:hypothetical protein